MFKPSQILVLVIERNPILLEGIATLIRSQPDMRLAGSVSTAEAGLELYRQIRPDFTVVDLDLPLAGGMDVIRRIRVSNSHAHVIGIALYELDGVGLEALAAGATAVIAIDQIAESLLDLIRASS